MDLKKPVIVTCLYDIGRENWKNFKMSYHTYLHWGEQVLSIDCPIVIFTEEKFSLDIVKIRQKFDEHLNNTKVIVKEKTELEMYKMFYNDIDSLMKSTQFSKVVQFDDVPEMCQPWYNIIMFSKLSFMYEVYLNQFFPNDLLIWKDFALYREQPELYKNTKWPDVNKIDNTKPTFFQHHDNISIHNNDTHILSQMRFTHGGCFTIPGFRLNPLKKQYINLVREYLDKGLIGSDEKYFDFIIKENPETFKLIKSDWRQYFKPFMFDN